MQTENSQNKGYSLAAAVVECDPQAKEAARILSERQGEINLERPLFIQPPQVHFIPQTEDGYTVKIEGNDVWISADRVRGYIAGVGSFLDWVRKADDTKKNVTPHYYAEIPRYPIRIHYMPAHFGNAFEMSWPSERQRYLEDLALAGASGYGDWFNPYDMPDPYNSYVYYSTSMAIWNRKKEFMRIAKSLGLETMLFITHNVAYTNQMLPQWVGVQSHEKRVQGQVLCPSIPEARRVCLQNHDNLFGDLAESDVVVDKVCFGPYDDGGCGCDKCQPYYPVFLSMVIEIMDIVKKYYPLIKGDICGWWASQEEMRQLKDFAQNAAKEWFHSFQYSVTYQVFAVPPDIKGQTGDIPLSTFFHIGFSNNNSDVYLKSGIHSATRRIQSVIASFEPAGCLGFHTYNESFGDHFNEYICNRLACNPDLDVAECTLAYCRRMFGLKGEQAREAARVLLEIEYLEGGKAAGWAAALEALKPFVTPPPGMKWAFEQLLKKAQLMALDDRITTEADWSSRESIAPMLPEIEKRKALFETLLREDYGLSILRHCFNPQAMMPAWYGDYLKHYPEKNGRILPGSKMSVHA